MINLFTLVVDYLVFDMVVDIISALVDNGLDGFISIIDTYLDLVPSSISPPISVTGVTLEALGITRIVLSLLLVISTL